MEGVNSYLDGIIEICQEVYFENIPAKFLPSNLVYWPVISSGHILSILFDIQEQRDVPTVGYLFYDLPYIFCYLILHFYVIFVLVNVNIF